MARAKTNLLKDMKITEVSLVTAPMCPDADILFTKGKSTDWREVIKGDVVVGKAQHDTGAEPRDKRGRWTSAAIAAIGGQKGSYRRQVAQAFSDKAKAIAHATVGNTVSAVATTRPSGANPVRGGGVQFQFEHRLASSRDASGSVTGGARVTSSVQIRPEHLGAVGEGKEPNKAQRALHTLHRTVHTFGREMVEPFGDGKKFSFLRASVHPGDLARTASSLFAGGGGSSGGPAPAPTSTAAPSSGIGWKPSAIKPSWVQDAYQLKPVGHGRRTDLSDPEAPAIPLGGQHTARTAGGWAYHTREGHFIPAGRPDVQEHIERVHQDLARMPEEQRAGFIRNRTGGAYVNVSEDKGYFTHKGDYVPPVGDQGNRAQNRLKYEQKYDKERERLASVANLHGGATQAPSPAHTLFGSHTPGGGRESEYDLGSPEQQQAAREAVRADMTRKSLFAAIPDDFPVTHLPPAPHQQTLKWNIDRGPSFAVGVPSEESKLAKQRRRYARAAVKAKIRS